MRAVVADLWVDGNWNSGFRKAFNDWELESIQQFLDAVGQKKICPSLRTEYDGSVQLMGYILHNPAQKLLKGVEFFWFLWRCCGTPYFHPKSASSLGNYGEERLWRLFKKRGFSLASICPLCGKAEETSDHLCLHSPKIRHLWNVLFSFPIHGCFCPTMVQELIKSWFILPLGEKEQKLRRFVPIWLLREIWRERNRVVF